MRPTATFIQRATKCFGTWCAAALVFAGIDTPPVFAQPNWTQALPVTSPSLRVYSAMAYDPIHQQTVLFGGCSTPPNSSGCSAAAGSETWTWDGSNWTRAQPAVAPSPRRSHVMAWDAVRQQIVLVGGVDTASGFPISDTWTWDGTSWSQLNTTGSPVFSNPSYLAFLPALPPSPNRLVLLIHGNYLNGQWIPPQTWYLDSVSNIWTKQSVAHTTFNLDGGALVYDPLRQSLVLDSTDMLIAGNNRVENTYLNSTYVPDWVVQNPGHRPPPTWNPSSAWAGNINSFIRFGGIVLGGTGDYSDTWEWDGDDWIQLSPVTVPGPRRAAAMAYDEARRQVVMFGGYNDTVSPSVFLADTWLFSNQQNDQWTEAQPTAKPNASYDFAMAFDPRTLQTILFGGSSNNTFGFAETWTWDGTNWQKKVPANSPPGGYWGAMADDGQELILFGGFNLSAAALSNDTWAWDGNNWTLKTPATRPPARRSAALAYDALHRQTVLFGGRDSNGTSFSDTWIWDGTTWTQKFPPSSPPGTVAVGMTFDAKHQNIVLFNGANNAASPSTTWLWDGNNWTQQSPSVYPPSRAGIDSISLTYDSANQRTVLFGGGGLNGAVLADTWAWDGTNWSQLAPVGQPPNREQVKLVYDAARQQTVLYGGLACGSANYCTDTWLLGSIAPTTTSVNITVPGSVQFTFNGVTYTGPQALHIAPGTYILSTLSPQTIASSQAVFGSWSDGGAQSHAVTVGPNALAITGNFNFLYAVVILAPQGVQYTLGNLMLTGTNTTFLAPGSYPLSVGSPQTIATGTTAQFVSWSDGGAQTHSITVASAALNVIGTFTLQYLVTTVSLPAAGGTVAGGGYYTRGSGVTLTATASAGYEFDYWSGPCAGSGSCYFGINAPVTVTANFSNSVQWYPLFPAAQPTPRTNASMAYDSQRKITVLFGGQDASGTLLNDTWEWDGTTWTKRTSLAAPSARKWEALTYDALNHQTVLFGGLTANGVRVADTWIWDGINWTQKIVSGPSVRSSTRMAFDAARNQIVLFGGANTDTTEVGDTWTWNGSVWTQKFPTRPPPSRGGHMLVYDEARQQTVLFGGGVIATDTDLNDTWVWDGTNWTQVSPSTSPEGRLHFAAAFDQTLQQIAIFGGYGTGNFANVVWLWDGSNWTKKTYSASPTDRGEIAAAYDAARSQYVAFGGYDGGEPIFLNGYTNDAWIFANNLHPAQFALTSTANPANGGTVTQYAVGQPGPLFYAGTPVAATAVPSAGFELQSWSGACAALQRCVATLNANQSVTANFGPVRNWVQLFPSSAPIGTGAAAYGVMAYDKARQQTVLFDPQGHTWTFDGTNWTLTNPANKPPPGSRQLVYDEANGQTLLFGGFTATDTWTWDGVNWTQRFPANHPSARITFGFGYNAANGTVVLYGGNGATILSDTWIWDGRALTWTQVFPTHTPSARTAPSVAFDPVNRGILLFGGLSFDTAQAQYFTLADTYLWNGSDWLQRSPASAPASRHCAAMVLDEGRQDIVLFGGEQVFNNPNSFYADTWVWDGTNWTQRTPGTFPPGRVCPAMDYDGSVGLPLLFGGTGLNGTVLADTWVYGAPPPPSQYTLTASVIGNGTLTETNGGPTYASGTTVQITATASPGYEFEYWSGGACTGSSPVCSVVMNGNRTAVANFAAPIQWVQLSPSASPSPTGATTENLTMAYDEAHQQIVFFGGPYGSRYGNQTWLWNGTTWTQAFPATIPPARDACGLAYDPVHQQIVMFGGYNGAPLADTWVWDGSNWTEKAGGAPGPSGRLNHGMAFDGHRIVLFGGFDGKNVNLSDTWTWDGNTWTQIFPASSPGPRSDFGMSFDAARQQVVLFSGFAGMPDTWIWDGTTWTNRPTASAPPGGWNAMAYDSARQQTFVVTESFGLNAPSQTWAWDGTSWTKKNTIVSPGTRYASAMAFDAARQQTILFGGFTGSVAADTWTLVAPSTNLVPQAPTVVRSGANYLVTVAVKNQGNVPITSISLTAGKVGSATGAPTTPAALSGIAPGAIASFTVQVPIASVPGTTAALSFTGSYSTQLTTNAPWSANVRSVTLP